MPNSPAATPRLALIGGGKMGEALIGGLLKSGWCRPDEALIVEPDANRRAAVAYLGVPTVDAWGATVADGAIIAVKPHYVADVCRDLRGSVRRVLSVAAGVTTSAMQAALDDSSIAVVRSMPNTPALVGVGASAIAGGTTATGDDLDWAAGILASVGIVERVTEAQLDAVTGLSGSGPAYVFLVAESLIEAGVLVGLPRSTATALAVQTLRGASEMLTSGREPASLRADVTSPGGTTAAGLRALEHAAVRSAFLDAVAAATARSRELGS